MSGKCRVDLITSNECAPLIRQKHDMKRILLYIIGTLLLLALWAGVVFWGTVQGIWHEPITAEEDVEAFIAASEDKINSDFVGNFAMAILKGGKVIKELYHSTDKPVDHNTVFQVASLSKWVSAIGIMKLVEDGKLDLDAPVSTYLTRWQLPPSEFNNDGVTVRRLLSHMAGLTDGLGYSGFEEGEPIQPLEESLIHASDADEGVSGQVMVGIRPGSEFKYSGGGYTLLQLLVEEVTGQTFAKYMETSVLRPMGLKYATYDWQEVDDNTLVDFYNSDGTPAKHYRYTSLAATSLYVSMADLITLAQAHLMDQAGAVEQHVLLPNTVKKMREPHAWSMGAPIWGLGTILYTPLSDGDYIFGHDGKSTPPINTALRLNPETGDGIIVLETGHPDLATTLASEWVFWKTGQVDNLLFVMMMDTMIMMIIVGWAIILLLAVAASYYHYHKSKGAGRRAKAEL